MPDEGEGAESHIAAACNEMGGIIDLHFTIPRQIKVWSVSKIILTINKTMNLLKGFGSTMCWYMSNLCTGIFHFTILVGVVRATALYLWWVWQYE